MGSKEMREAVSAAFASMEEAHEALTSADTEAEGFDPEALEARFSEAETAHAAAVAKLARAEKVEAAKAALPVAVAEDTQERTSASVVREPLTYEQHSPNSVFRDLMFAERGNVAAAQRLDRHMSEMRVEGRMGESRDLSSTDSAGGYLVAPIWLQDEFVDLRRAGRAVANAIGSRPLPPKTDSVNLPTMATGTTVATQSDNGSVSETDATFGTVAADVLTVAGLQDVSQQVVDRSVPGIDGIIFADLAKAYNVNIDTAVINSSTSNNKGLAQVSSIGTSTFTSATPTLAGLYPKIADSIQQIHVGIFASPDVIFMHPRRWAFILAALDGNNRPAVTPYSPQNASALQERVGAENVVGSIQGLPVVVDSNIPTTGGAGTNEDIILTVARQECYVWEDQGGPYLDTFRDVGSGTLTVRFRLFNYWAQCNARRPKAITKISGTGLVTPSF